MATNGWDIIGDVHGRLEALEALLTKLGYSERDGAWRHPTRRALFIGDLVDRGVHVGGVLHLVRAMVEADAARVIMGNHEYNVLGRKQDERDGAKDVRCRMTPQKTSEMAPTIEAFEADPTLEPWLLRLPLWLEIDGARFVHAYWGAREMALLDGRATLAEAGWDGEWSRNTPARVAVDRILKGPEIRLPVPFRNKHGVEQEEARVAWWKTPSPGAAVNDLLVSRVAKIEGQLASSRELRTYEPYAPAAPPVFIGHYGFRKSPGLLARNVVCVDFEGALTAYRWDGEMALDAECLVSV